jgi:hypothetical protein
MLNKKQIEFIKQVIKDKEYSVSGWLVCYECDCIGDEDYYCTTCDGYSGEIEDTLSELVEYIEELESALEKKQAKNNKVVLGSEEEQMELFGEE